MDGWNGSPQAATRSVETKSRSAAVEGNIVITSDLH
jgi:hypothetical protein